MTTMHTRSAPAPRTNDAALATPRPQWDYTEHAQAYLARPEYPSQFVATLAQNAGVDIGQGRIVELGAGTGNMTLALGSYGRSYIAVEPNDAMRELGQQRSADLPVRWIKGTAEATTLPAASADWIMCAQCFDTFEPAAAMRELHRVASPGARLTVLWNHRVWTDDPLEARIERLVSDRLGGYNRGTRRVDPSTALTQDGLFEIVQPMEHAHTVIMSPERYVTVWRSVRTLRVQAGQQGFEDLLADIAKLVRDAGVSEIPVKYVCRAWTARRVGL